jgi:hopene-associated glycosyltransferase HpnB
MPIAISVSLLVLLAWVYLLAGHGRYWRTDQRLPPGPAGGPAQTTAWPAVVAVIPARNEAVILPRTLPTLLAQDYRGPLAVVLVDDESTDGTSAVAASLSREAAQADPRAGERLTVISGAATPQGWAGKVWAMAQGAAAVGDAEYLLFTDADIGYAQGTVAALVSAAESGEWAMVSQMALLRAEAFWERLLIPAFVYFFAQLYPFRRVNRRAGRTAAAAGGCMLVRREALDAAGGLEPIKGARIDDVALAKLLKRSGRDCWLGFSTDVVSYREYSGRAVWDMVARSAYTQLRYSAAALVGTVLGLAWLYLLPVAATLAGLVLLAGGPGLSGIPAWQAACLAAAGAGSWAIMSVTYVPVLRLSRLSPSRALLIPLIAAGYAAMTVSSGWRHHAGRGGEWKGRTIQQSEAAAGGQSPGASASKSGGDLETGQVLSESPSTASDETAR